LDVRWANDKRDDMLMLEINCFVSGRYIGRQFKYIYGAHTLIVWTLYP
jgi:hypothetical protein